jgi:hypothetical protein
MNVRYRVALTQYERNELLASAACRSRPAAGGALSAEGLTRARNAVLANAYGDADVRRF